MQQPLPVTLSLQQELYFGTPHRLTPGSQVSHEIRADRRIDALLDSGRPPSAPPRSSAAVAATSVRDATAIAAIQVYDRTNPSASRPIHVYRVRLVPFHVAPVAIATELLRRVETGAPAERLVREYWAASGEWHLNEVLAPLLTVVHEVERASEAEIYVRQWVEFRRDQERALGL